MPREMFTEDKEEELTNEELEKLLVVKISSGTDIRSIKNNIELGMFMRFVVTNNFRILIAPGSMVHDVMLENNGLDWEDCWITNGVVRERGDGDILFSYHSASRESAHRVIERKILKFLQDQTGAKLNDRKTSSIYSTD